LILQIMFLSLIGSLLCLDRVLLQAMISRPIIVGPVLGLILGNPYAGLIIGAIMELFWIDRIPVGIYMPPNDSVVTAFAVSVAVLAGQALGSVSKELMALAILLAIPFGIAARIIDVKMMSWNNALSDGALEDARARNIRAIERKTWMGLGRMYLLYAVQLFILLLVFTPLVIRLFPKIPAPVKTMLSLTYYFLPLLGIGVAINTIKLRGAVPIFCALFLILAAAMEYFHVF
jgi:mannose/fructose/N-acetylgalactosamine-specific phosphotransferase system component IIC